MASGELSIAELTGVEAGQSGPLGKREGKRQKSESSASTFLSENVGRKIQIQRSGHLNLYLLLDASQSVAEDDFRVFKESAILMVDRVRKWEPGHRGGFPVHTVSLRFLLFLRTPLTVQLFQEVFPDFMHVMKESWIQFMGSYF